VADLRERRTLKAVCVRHFGFPPAPEVIQVTRKTRDLHINRRRGRDRICDHQPPFELARLADLLRGHWAIEALHHIRDVIFCETPRRSAPAAAQA
jgi:hypothetical protein